jgi:hypothetical protein
MSVLSSIAAQFPTRIRYLRQTKADNCAQTVVAMVLGVPVDAVEREAGTDGAMTVNEVLGILARLGFFTRPISAKLAGGIWPAFYARSGGRKLRGLGFRMPRGGEVSGHAYFLAGGRMYDPATGERRGLDADVVRNELDWLVLFPVDLYSTPALRRFLGAMGWESPS